MSGIHAFDVAVDLIICPHVLIDTFFDSCRMGQKKICIKNPSSVPPSSKASSSKSGSSTAAKTTPTKATGKQTTPSKTKTPVVNKNKRPAASPKAKNQPAVKKQKVGNKKVDTPSSSKPSSSAKITTESASSQRRKERLASNPFGAHRYVDWELLRGYGIEAEIKELLSIGPWEALFDIRTPAFYDITLEVLSTMELDDKDYSKGINAHLDFTAYGKHHSVPLTKFCVYMGLYTEDETNTPEFHQLSNNWPLGATQVNYWKQICGAEMEYYPSKSKASAIQNVHLRVIHWILANTIGARKSSTGVVNNFELFFIHSIATRYKINIGVELAHYLYRQASDPRSKGIYCGGYITKLLQGMKVFKEPAPGSRHVLISKVTDGPFAGWGLEKIIQAPKRVYSTPPRSIPVPSPSTSSAQPPKDILRKLDRMEKALQKERAKSKRFRAFAVKMLLRIGRCITPPPKDLPSYTSSSDSEDSSSDSEDIAPPTSKSTAPTAPTTKDAPSTSKAPAKEVSSDSEELDDEEDTEEEEEADDAEDDEDDEDGEAADDDDDDGDDQAT